MSAARTTVWFLDTSSLLSMAVDKDIEAAVLDEIGNDRVVIIDIVQDELNRRAGIPETAGLAKIALTCIKPHWSAMDTSRYVSLADVQSAQEDVADGRTLTDDMQQRQELQPDADSGRGLVLVEALSAAWGSFELADEPGKVVWATERAPFDPPATVGQVVDLWRARRLGLIFGMGRRRLGEIEAALVVAGFALRDASPS